MAVRPVFPTQLRARITEEMKNTDSWAVLRKALVGRDERDPEMRGTT